MIGDTDFILYMQTIMIRWIKYDRLIGRSKNDDIEIIMLSVFLVSYMNFHIKLWYDFH